jgi:hypothetical protein
LLRTEPNRFKVTMTTLFWVGEPSTDKNDFIPNHQSYWDKDWQTNYGGVDDPERRNGHWSADFTPKQNLFYVALPYGEFTERNELKKDARRVPWYRSGLDPLLKNRWVEIERDGRSCFAQWQDVGPRDEDDFGFVFGKAHKPRHSFDAKAGPRCLTGGLALSRHARQQSRRLALRRSRRGPTGAMEGQSLRSMPSPQPISCVASPTSVRRPRSHASGSHASLVPPHPRPIV